MVHVLTERSFLLYDRRKSDKLIQIQSEFFHSLETVVRGYFFIEVVVYLLADLFGIHILCKCICIREEESFHTAVGKFQRIMILGEFVFKFKSESACIESIKEFSRIADALILELICCIENINAFNKCYCNSFLLFFVLICSKCLYYSFVCHIGTYEMFACKIIVSVVSQP